MAKSAVSSAVRATPRHYETMIAFFCTLLHEHNRGLGLRLLWLQDTGEVLPAAGAWYLSSRVLSCNTGVGLTVFPYGPFICILYSPPNPIIIRPCITLTLFVFWFFRFTIERLQSCTWLFLYTGQGKIVERPQHLIMRTACGIHMGDLAAALETYDLISRKYFTHASPTLFNAGTPTPQMSSCFLLKMKEDSIDGIYDTLKLSWCNAWAFFWVMHMLSASGLSTVSKQPRKQCALISKSAGGIGVAISNVRASGSYIRGTNGYSNGFLDRLQRASAHFWG